MTLFPILTGCHTNRGALYQKPPQDPSLNTEDLSHLVEPLGLEPLSEDLPDAGQVRHRLLVHRLSHKVAVLLRRRAHLDSGVASRSVCVLGDH